MKSILPLRHKKTEVVLLACLFFSLVLFYPELFIARMAMLTGDHAIQHYPWAYLLSKSLKHFEIPFWTSALHSGFPITAEGQMGALYPPNWFFLGLLPTQWGYSYLHVFHFLLAGWGMYGYARILKLSPTASFVAAFVYLFGTVYGGAYYNITSLKTLAWFPWMLFFFECFSRSLKKRFIGCIALASALTILAGYLQVAVYSLAMFVFYVGIRLWLFPFEIKLCFKERLAKNAWVFAGLALGVILAVPQLILTYDLAMRSTRAAPVEEYAYIGSMFPAALATFFYPMLQGLFRGNSLYIGMAAVWLVPICFFCREVRRMPSFKVWALFTLFSILLSLGEWSPLYVFLIKVSHFYSFRTPAKFLFFICFGLAVLAGMGWDRLREDIQKGAISGSVRRSSQLYGFFFVSTLAGIAALTGILSNGGIWIREWGYAFVEKSFFGKMGHPHSLEDYHQKWDASMESVLRTIDLSNHWNAVVLGLMLIGGIMASLPLLCKRVPRFFLGFLLLFTVTDLYLFSWNDLRKDFAYYSSLTPSALVKKLIQEKKDGKGGRLYGFRSADDLLPLLPSENMLYDLEDIGAYSPFVTSRYLETIGLFGNIDDSNGLKTPSLSFLKRHQRLLDFMNVSHVLSSQSLDMPGWVLLEEENKKQNYYLYRNENPHAPAYFVSAMEVFETWTVLRDKWMGDGAAPSQVIYLEKSEWQKIKTGTQLRNSPQRELSSVKQNKKMTNDEDVWTVMAGEPGFFVRSVLYDPKWTCTLNDQSVPVVAAQGLFQAVWISAPGTYRLHFRYYPFRKSTKD